ncbi:MAG: diguanylate cyclase [Casimicrobiaceae bacterium]
MAKHATRRHDDVPFGTPPDGSASIPIDEAVRIAIKRAQELDAGDSGQSLALATEAVTLSLGVAQPTLQAAAKECLGTCQLHQGIFDAAFTNISAAIAVWAFAGDRAGEAGARCALAELLEKLGQTDKALGESLAALRLAEDSGDRRAQTLVNIVVGIIYTSLRQYDEALAVLHTAQAAAAGLDDPLLVARALNNLGNVHNDRGSALLRCGENASAKADLESGLALYKGAADSFECLGELRLAGIALRNAALGLSLMRRFDEADAILEGQLAASRAKGSRVSEESVLRFRGTAYLEQGRFADAIESLLGSCRIAEDMKFPEREADAHEMLATAYEGSGDFARSLAHLRKFHAQQARVVNDANQRRARAVALQFQAERFKADAAEARLRAHDLETSNRELLRETERLSAEMLIDPLTGLFNRRHFEIVLRPDLARRDASVTFSVAIVDIDYFKRVNDRYSHQVGDEVLRHVGAIFRRECRQGEFAVRYGGEEFALVFPNAGLVDARAACDRLRASIERHEWSIVTVGLALTVSAGVAESGEAETFDSLLSIADQRLYAAKAQGRNRVVSSCAAR